VFFLYLLRIILNISSLKFYKLRLVTFNSVGRHLSFSLASLFVFFSSGPSPVVPFHASLATESQWAIPTPGTISVNVLLRIPEVPWGVRCRQGTSSHPRSVWVMSYA